MTTEKQENLTKLEKMNDDINKKFGVKTDISKMGGRWCVAPKKGCEIESRKMKEIREYVIMYSEELEDDDI